MNVDVIEDEDWIRVIGQIMKLHKANIKTFPIPGSQQIYILLLQCSLSCRRHKYHYRRHMGFAFPIY